jgi:hypothetical protein
MSEEMKKVRILFYVTPKKFKWKYKVNFLISLWTRSKYSHCEVWVAEHNGYGFIQTTTEHPDPSRIGEVEFIGTCYTSTLRGESNGTVKRPASEVLDHPENWMYIEAEMPTGNYNSMMRFLENEVRLNKGYSKRDLMKFLSPVHFPDNKRNICSEIVNNALCVGLLLRGFGIIDPKEVSKKLLKEKLEIKKLI